MELSKLTDGELLVFVGLVKLVVHADREISAEEREVLGRLQADVGAGRWNQAIREAREAFPTVETLEVEARKVEREEAQALIHDVLMELAGSDEVIDAETHVLQWVVQEWGLHDDAEEEEPDASSFESFVLLDDD